MKDHDKEASSENTNNTEKNAPKGKAENTRSTEKNSHTENAEADEGAHDFGDVEEDFSLESDEKDAETTGEEGTHEKVSEEPQEEPQEKYEHLEALLAGAGENPSYLEEEDDDIVHNEPREATDPFAPQGMPLALLEFHSPTQGMVNLPATASARYIVWIIGGLCAACIAAMALFPVNKVVRVSGRLISDSPTLLIQPFESSIVRSIDVHIGDFVRKGQIIAHLDPSITQADLDSLVPQMESFRAQIERLKAEAAGEEFHPDMNVPASIEQGEAYLRRKKDYDASLQDFDQRLASLSSDLKGLVATKAMLESKRQLVSSVLAMRRQEEKDQVGSRLSTLGAQDTMLDTERTLISTQQGVHSTEEKLAALQATRESYIQSWKVKVYAELTEVESRYDELRSKYNKARIHQKLILLRAPEDGVVLTIGHVSIGSVIEAGMPLATLVPSGSGLQMEGIMTAQDGGYVKNHDHALIKFATFPYDMYGGADGHVDVISSDTFMPQEAVAGNIRAGVDPKQFAGQSGVIVFYRVRLRVDHYTLHNVPSFFHPTPGVPVTAEIDVGKRTILEYLFSRIAPAVSEGMREPS